MVKVSAARKELARRLRDNIVEHRARRPDIAEAYAQLATAVERPVKLTLWPEAGPRRCSESMVDLLAAYFDPLPLIQKALVAMGWKQALTANFVDWIGDSHSLNERQHENPGLYYEEFSGALLCAIEELERLDWATGTAEEATYILPAATSAARSIVSLLRSIAQLDCTARPKKTPKLTAVDSGIGHCSVCHQQVYRPGGKTCLEHFRDKDAPAPEAYQAAYRRMDTLRKHRVPGEHQKIQLQLRTKFFFGTSIDNGAADALLWDTWIDQLDAALAAAMPHIYNHAGPVKNIPSPKEFARWLKTIDPSRQEKMLLDEWQAGQPAGIGNAELLTRLLTMAERSLALDAARKAACERQAQCKELIAAGLTYSEIAQMLKISRQAVQQLARNLGTPKRTPGRPKKNASSRTPVHC